MIDSWPTHVEELSRKTADTFIFWMDKLNRGLISNREAYIVVSVLYDNVSGLVDQELASDLAAAHAVLLKELNGYGVE